MLDTPVPIRSLKLGQDTTWRDDRLGTPSAAGMGSDVGPAWRQVDSFENRAPPLMVVYPVLSFSYSSSIIGHLNTFSIVLLLCPVDSQGFS